MALNIEIIKELYTDFSNGDIDSMKGKFAPEIEWIQMKGFPNGGHHIGFDDINKNVFQNFGQHWTNWTAKVEEFLDAGKSVLAVGKYEGTYKETGKSFQADFIHRYVLENAKITRFIQYTDTHLIVRAME